MKEAAVSQVDVSQTVTISQKDWQKIMFEIFSQDKKIAELEASLNMFKVCFDVADGHRLKQIARIYDLEKERDQTALDLPNIIQATRRSERQGIIEWFARQGFMPIMLLTGRGIANRLRKVLLLGSY